MGFNVGNRVVCSIVGEFVGVAVGTGEVGGLVGTGSDGELVLVG